MRGRHALVLLGLLLAALVLRGSVPPLERAAAQRPRDDVPAAPAAPATPVPRAAGTGEPAPVGRPGPGDTGVPAGTTLTPYTGPCAITAAGAVIEARSISCPALLIQAPDVTIRGSSMQRSSSTPTSTGRGR